MKKLNARYFIAAIILAIGAATGAYFSAEAQHGQIAFSTGLGVIFGAVAMPLLAVNELEKK